MVEKLVGKKVIYAVWHDRSVRTGWCERVQEIWPGGRLWPHIADDESGATLVVFGPVIPYDEHIAEELGWMGMERSGGFMQCWEWLLSMDCNRYGDSEQE